MFLHMHLYHTVKHFNKADTTHSFTCDAFYFTMIASWGLCPYHKSSPCLFLYIYTPLPRCLFRKNTVTSFINPISSCIHSAPKCRVEEIYGGVDTCYPNLGTALICNRCCSEWYICTDATLISRYRPPSECLFNMEKWASHTNQVKA